MEMPYHDGHHCNSFRENIRYNIEAFKALASLTPELSSSLLVQSIEGLLEAEQAKWQMHAQVDLKTGFDFHLPSNDTDQNWHSTQCLDTMGSEVISHPTTPPHTASTPITATVKIIGNPSITIIPSNPKRRKSKKSVKRESTSQNSILGLDSNLGGTVGDIPPTPSIKRKPIPKKGRPKKAVKVKNLSVKRNVGGRGPGKGRRSKVNMGGPRKGKRGKVKVKLEPVEKKSNSDEKPVRKTNVLPITAKNSLSLAKLQSAKQSIEKVKEGTQTKFKCLICNKILTALRTSLFHVRRIHFHDRITCHKCRGKFYDYKSLNSHQEKCQRKPDPTQSSIDQYFAPSTTKPRTVGKSRRGQSKIKIEQDDGIENIEVRNPFPNFDLKKTLTVKVKVPRVALLEAVVLSMKNDQKGRMSDFVKTNAGLGVEPEIQWIAPNAETSTNYNGESSRVESREAGKEFKLPFDIEVKLARHQNSSSGESRFIQLTSIQVAELNEWDVNL